MHIESVTLQNFRCFGSEPTIVNLGPEVTALVGANGSGKSAFIAALRRLFGVTREERTLTRADVHFGSDERPDDVPERQVVIDVVFAFPELRKKGSGAAKTIPEVFKVMTAAGPGKPLKARLRLEALWKGGESFEDELESSIYWVMHLDEVAFGEDDAAGLEKQRVHNADRAKIQLMHIPATRDGSAVTRQALRQLLRRIERSGDFGASVEEEVAELSADIQSKVDDLPALKWVTDRLTKNWAKLHTGGHLGQPRLAVLSQEFKRLLRSLEAKLSPGEDGRERSIEELSEGQASLFFLALAATLAQLEAELAKGTPPVGFTDLDVAAPALTIYAVEEPENHLAPFYLSRLMTLLGELSAGNQAMGLVTSHAPGVVRRVGPEAVRHFRLDQEQLVTQVNRIRLPEDDAEAAKYVREAVLAQPEIYFASLVILGEGDSEGVVIPRVSKALGVDLDPSFVAFAPLGGRHVNHFWRLLSDLNIPHATLLDFDLGRHGAGPLRLKYVWDRLKEGDGGLTAPDWAKGKDLSKSAYWKSLAEAEISQWRDWFEGRAVCFSYPLDLDMMMVRAFPEAYNVDGAAEFEDEARVAMSVFGSGPGLEIYGEKAKAEDHPTNDELAAYDTLFKKRGKPGSHLNALAKLEDETIAANCPPVLRELIEAASRALSTEDEDAGGDEL